MTSSSIRTGAQAGPVKRPFVDWGAARDAAAVVQGERNYHNLGIIDAENGFVCQFFFNTLNEPY